MQAFHAAMGREPNHSAASGLVAALLARRYAKLTAKKGVEEKRQSKAKADLAYHSA
jgi:hypothetical protein